LAPGQSRSVSKMGANEQLVKAVTNRLLNRLERHFVETATACSQKWGQEDRMPPPRVPPCEWTYEGATIVAQPYEHWRERSLESVDECFKSLVELRVPADAAIDMIWEVIYQVFHWTEDKNNSAIYAQFVTESQRRAVSRMVAMVDARQAAQVAVGSGQRPN